jgi:hypothetical protein
MKRRFSVLLILPIVCLCAALIFSPTNALAAKTYLRFSTAGTGGTYYPMGGAIAALLTKQIPWLNVSAETSGGSAENVRLIEQGVTDMAWANASEIYWGWNGIKYFEDKKYQNMRIVARVWTNHYHWLCLAKTDVHGPMDYTGKKITIGPQGSGAALHAETLLRTIGIWDDVNVVWLPPTAAANALKDGQTKVFGYFSGIPMAAVLDIQALNKIRLLDVTKVGEEHDFTEKYPFYNRGIIPAGTYKGQDEDVGIYQQSTYWIVRKDLPEDQVYEMVKTLFSPEGLKYMANAHKRGQEVSLDHALDGVGGLIPLHPGAIKFYKEKGLDVPE